MNNLDIGIMLLLALLLVLILRVALPLSDYDFKTGLVRCGVAGLSASCGSTVDRDNMWSPIDTGKK